MADGVGALALVSRGLINASPNGKPRMRPSAGAGLSLRAHRLRGVAPDRAEVRAGGGCHQPAALAPAAVA
jgi:hypothetical protein